MRLWELVRLAMDGVRRTPLRVALTSLGVAIATGALFSMVAFALGVQARVEEPFQKTELVNRINISAKPLTRHRRGLDAPGQDSRDAAKQASPPVLDAAALARIAALPGVVLAYPELQLERLKLTSGTKSVTAFADTLPREAGRLRFVQDAIVAGCFFDPDDAKEIILGVKLANTLGFASPADAVGRTLTIQAAGLSRTAERTFHLEERTLEVQVAGVWNPARWSADEALLPLDLISQLPGTLFHSALEQARDGTTNAALSYDRAVVRVDRPAALFYVEEQIQKMGFQTQALLSQIKEMRTGFIIMDLILTSVGTVALIVAGLGIINTLLMAVLERYREIGIYKALGASDGDIRILFLAEAGIVGLLGGFGGLLLGRAVSCIIEIVVNSIAQTYGLDEPIAVFAFPFWLLLDAVLFALVVSLLSGVYPASRAAKVDPIRALRAE